MIELTCVEYINFYQCELDFEVVKTLQEMVPKQLKEIHLHHCRIGGTISNPKVIIDN